VRKADGWVCNGLWERKKKKKTCDQNENLDETKGKRKEKESNAEEFERRVGKKRTHYDSIMRLGGVNGGGMQRGGRHGLRLRLRLRLRLWGRREDERESGGIKWDLCGSVQ